MKNITKQTSAKDALVAGKQRSYNEIIEFLDKHWSTPRDLQLQTIKKLDQAFDNPSQRIKSILIAGSNGKSLTVNYTALLLKSEGLAVGALYSPHILTYNERLSINNESISNKLFTEIGNEVINTAEALNIQAHSSELLTVMALRYFDINKVDVALWEVEEGNNTDPVAICNPKILGITRITPDDSSDESVKKTIQDMVSIVRPGTAIISADQSKLNLQVMLDLVKERKGTWAMPIRKLAPLPYPLEQLHGRCAALAERIAQLYVNQCADPNTIVVSTSLLTKQKGQRGRPTLAAKKQIQENPPKTIEQFWKEEHPCLPGHFQLLDKEKPSLLLDVASNLDAFKNILLGIRLLHYQRPLKGLTLVIGSNNNEIPLDELLKLLRYFFKKTSGQVFICPVESQPYLKKQSSWDVEKVTNEIKSMKVKAKACKDFKDAFENAQKSVDERYGLVILTGSPAIVTEYWQYKGIKKL